MQRLFFVVALLSVGQWALGQDFDCNTDEGQHAFLMNGARTDPGCYNPVIELLRDNTVPSAAEVEAVCKDECAGEMVDFLRSTEECRNNNTVQENVYYLQNELCAYKDGDNGDTSCALLSYDDINGALESCFGWWWPGNTTCPPLLPGVETNTSCANALKAAVEQYGCCFQNLFSTDQYIDTTTTSSREELARINVAVSDDFKVVVTDPALFEACDQELPKEMCQSQLPITGSAPSQLATPLLALLFATIAKLFA